jgi:site-specific recombinase XerD
MAVHSSWTLDALVAAYGQHLRRARGLRSASVAKHSLYVRRFVRGVLGDDPIDVGRLRPEDVVSFVLRSKDHFRPRTAGAIGIALRSFFRFLRSEGLIDGRLEAAVPSVASWRLAALPRGLSDEQLERLLESASTDTGPYAVRDLAVLRCLAGLGLRAGEVADLRLDDINWREGTLHISAHKTRRAGVLPLPHEVGRAVVAYLRTGRPTTSERRVFVRRDRGGGVAPLGCGCVSRIVARALRRAGIDAPIRGAYVLRHTLASRMVRHGTSIKEVGDFLGHRSLDTTTIYAKLDLPALRDVALPWPEVTP